jgi:Domain of unknown function (DUF5348)
VSEGRLVRSVTEGRWAINDPNEGYELTSGRTVELWLGGQWIEGHIERYEPYGGYYFVSHKGGYYALCVGMRVRVRLS